MPRILYLIKVRYIFSINYEIHNRYYLLLDYGSNDCDPFMHKNIKHIPTNIYVRLN